MIGAVAAVAVPVSFATKSKADSSSQIQKSITYWQALIDKEIPSGSTNADVIKFSTAHHLSLTFIPVKNLFDGNVQQIPDEGIGLPCSEWNIIVDIYMGKDGKSVGRKVQAIGTCL